MGNSCCSGAVDDPHLLKKCEIQLNGTLLSIVHGNIAHEEVDIIVNDANKNLNHGGGVAGELVRVGGVEIQRESNRYIRDNGELSYGKIVVTSAYGLKAKHVIHAVGPIARKG
jgi:O-acetyl-ADP-ribose deacetylase (regulator of RNase III)